MKPYLKWKKFDFYVEDFQELMNTGVSPVLGQVDILKALLKGKDVTVVPKQERYPWRQVERERE